MRDSAATVVWSFLKKLEIELLYDLVILFWRLYIQREMESESQRGTYTSTFILALFHSNRMQKQPGDILSEHTDKL